MPLLPPAASPLAPAEQRKVDPTPTYDPPPVPPPDFQIPAYEEATAAAAGQAKPAGVLDAPPDYFDPMEGSTVPFKRTSAGCVETHDPILDSNPDELYRFFMTHLVEKPALIVRITGSHTESHTRTETTTNADGSTSTHTVTETRTVTDFSFRMDASNYVAPDWERCVARARKNKPQDSDFGQWREVLEAYTSSTNQLKEIHLKKEIIWDYANLTPQLRALVRMTGYRNDIHISYEHRAHEISVYSSSEIMKLSRACWMRTLCVITCLWIIFLPAFLIARRNVKDRLHAYYNCVAPASVFYNNNAGIIAGAEGMQNYADEGMKDTRS
ncbi:hypothetical protein HK101_008587 [Irineochytrium annulatum]|nr:hypothetical protein HK101_008587 [Irineochytrium annulatum]